MSLPKHIAHHPGVLLHDIARLFRRQFGSQLQDLALTEPQWRALGAINRFEGLSQSQLADFLGIGRAPLGKLIDRLEQEGMVLRRADADDRRSKRLFLSDDGKTLANKIRRRYRRFQQQLLDFLDPETLAEMDVVLKSIYQRLASSPAAIMSDGEAHSNVLLWIALLNRMNQHRFDQRLKQLGFTRNQWLVMVAIAANEGLQQTELADQLQMAKAPLGTLIDQLEQTDRVQRVRATGDRRAYQLFLTPLCKNKLQQWTDDYTALHEQATSQLNAKQRKRLQEFLTHVRERLYALDSTASAETSEVAL